VCVDPFHLACSTTVNVALSFGGQTWSISPADFKSQQLPNSQQCLGAIFTFSTSTVNNVGPAWVIGDTFLKNVYTVFRANPASVGFAALASDAQSLVVQAGIPTATIGSVAATVTSSRSNSNTAASSMMMPCLAVLLSLCVAGSTSLFYLL
jgi:cathepsin D